MKGNGGYWLAQFKFPFCILWSFFLSNEKVKLFNLPSFIVENLKTFKLFTDIGGRKIARCEQDCNTFSLRDEPLSVLHLH